MKRKKLYPILYCSLYGMLQGFGLLLSSIIAGLLWDNINSDTPFLFGGVIGIVSALIIWAILDKNNLIKLFRKETRSVAGEN